ncbi:MAG: AraC family transcriptional regulator [Bacteroidota bacterium]
MKAEYRIGSPPADASFNVKLMNLPEFDVAWHYHPHFELTYMIQSTGIRYVGDSMEAYDRGDLVLIGSNLPHCYKTVESDLEVHCIVVHFEESALSGWFDKPELTNIQWLLSRSERGISFSSKESLSLEPYFLRLTQEPPFERLLTLLSILNQLAKSPNQQLLAGVGFNSTLSDKASDRVSIINNYIKDNIHDRISVELIATQLGMSKAAFARFFKKTFGKVFTQHINEYKINLASKMLIQTELSISEIGYRTGFNNLTFFHRQFNRFQHMSPSKYRKAFRQIK